MSLVFNFDCELTITDDYGKSTSMNYEKDDYESVIKHFEDDYCTEDGSDSTIRHFKDF